MRESKIEKQCCDWAKKHGWLVYKFTSPGNCGVMDRIFLKSGKAVLVEFKQPGGKLSTIQLRQIEKIKAHDFKVFVIDNFKSFVTAFER